MTDPWATTIANLSGSAGPPAVEWPEQRTRRIECREDQAFAGDTAPKLAHADRQVLELIGDGALTLREVAYTLGIAREAADERLARLRRRGFLHKSGARWRRSDGPAE